MSVDDPYSRLQYRRLIAWPSRIEREWPFLREALGDGAGRRILDLGCGTGEHSRFLAAEGFAVVGVDRSAALLDQARSEPGPEPGNPRFFEADLGDFDEADLGEAAGGDFAGAVCLGNTLPHLVEADGVRRFFTALRRLLRPGAPLVLQILNYERIFTRRERYLPLNFRDDGDDQVVFLRLMDLRDDGTVLFCPTSLRFRPSAATPVEVVSSRPVPLRGWRHRELETFLDEAGFRDRRAHGGFGGESFLPGDSRDLVLVAR